MYGTYYLESLKFLDLITSGRDSDVYAAAPITAGGFRIDRPNVAVKLSHKNNISEVTKELVKHRHPHVERIYTIIKRDDIVDDYFTVCKMLVKTLGKYNKQTDPAPSALALDMMAGLCYLHEHDIIHCDIKNNNIMFDENKRLVFIDFNNAQYSDRAGKLELATVLHTRHKDLFQSLFDWNHKIDSWACGVILYELCANHYTELVENVLRAAGISFKTQYEKDLLDNCQISIEDKMNLANEFNRALKLLEQGMDDYNGTNGEIFQIIHFFMTLERVCAKSVCDFKFLFCKENKQTSKK